MDIEYNEIQFFTATILHWKCLLVKDRYKDIIIDSLCFLTKEKRVIVYGFVIMPNHIHFIWKINDRLKRQDVQRDFLKYTAQRIKCDLKKNYPKLLAQFRVDERDRRYQFWERNALSIDLYTQKVLEQKLEYIHNNPVQGRWHLVNDPGEYKYSSMRFYEQGIRDEWTFLQDYLNEI